MNEITIEYGKKIIKDNPFYFTLHLILKYYFNNTNEYYFFTFLKDITHSENEFKVFMIYFNYIIDIYNKDIKKINIKYENEDDFIYFLIGFLKNKYDNDRKVLKPYIKNITENEEEIIKKFNIAKSTYNYKKDALERFNNINNAIEYLKKAHDLELEAQKYKDMAMEMLINLKGEYTKTIYFDNKLIIKDKKI